MPLLERTLISREHGTSGRSPGPPCACWLESARQPTESLLAILVTLLSGFRDSLSAGDQGALGILVSFLERPLDPAAEQVDVEMRTDALHLVSCLCHADEHNKVCLSEDF